MEPTIFTAFSDELRHIQAGGPDTPHDYLETRAAAMVKLGFNVGSKIVGGVRNMVGPASRAGKFLGQHGDTVGHGLELAGLGTLAAPSISELRHTEDPREKFKAKAELAGLGTLALHPAAALGKHLLHL